MRIDPGISALNAAQPMTATKTPPSTLKFSAVPNVLVERQERIRLGRVGLPAHRTRKPPALAGGSSRTIPWNERRETGNSRFKFAQNKF